MLFVGRKGFLIPERYHFYCKKTWTDQVSYWDGMALNKPPWAFSGTFLNAKWLGFQWSVDNLFCSFLLSQKTWSMKTLEKTRLWLFSATISLSLPRRFPHHLRDFIYLSQPHLSSKRRNFAQSLYSLKDSIWNWYCAQRFQILWNPPPAGGMKLLLSVPVFRLKSV